MSNVPTSSLFIAREILEDGPSHEHPPICVSARALHETGDFLDTMEVKIKRVISFPLPSVLNRIRSSTRKPEADIIWAIIGSKVNLTCYLEEVS